MACVQIGNQMVVQNKRKEKARLAARARRSQEAGIIMEMANELHISQEKMRRIDKATIVKLAIDYIKAFEVLCNRICSSCRTGWPIGRPLAFRSVIPLAAARRQLGLVGRQGRSICLSQANGLVCEESDGEQQTGERERCPVDGEDLKECETDEKELGEEKDNEESKLYETSSADLAPKLSTGSIFAPKTEDMDSYFLMIKERDGSSSFVLKPDNEILDEDDLTHLAPQAGDMSIWLEVEPLDGIVLDCSGHLFGARSGAKELTLLAQYGQLGAVAD